MWQPIKTAPKDEKIIVYMARWKKVTLGLWRSSAYHNRGGSGWRISLCPADPWMKIVDAPTHWMHLPEPPALS